MPSDETQKEIFEEYVKYFQEKQRAGVVELRNKTIYLLCPGEHADRIHKIKDNELLGIFTENNPNAAAKPPRQESVVIRDDSDMQILTEKPKEGKETSKTSYSDFQNLINTIK
eukprot:TRINITY_DN8298_c0_g1_i3.p1 TRINITY_DN8298_c0_g1~~TRINITY_DN8298_c0_g1_i3.p1  ORF type:complete len:113 (-),score=29.87 TRINITY_DN8298_c0_g1_i3:149-487(-)